MSTAIRDVDYSFAKMVTIRLPCPVQPELLRHAPFEPGDYRPLSAAGLPLRIRDDSTRFKPPLGRIYCCPRSRHAKAAFDLQDQWLIDEVERAELLWVAAEPTPSQWSEELRPFQLLNHLLDEGVITNKAGLTRTLKAYEKRRQTGLSMHDFYPESFCLTDYEDREQFFKGLPDKDTPENLWIYKPAARADGHGIRVLWRFDELRRRYAKASPPQDEPGIVQRYIKNPLLLDGRKFDIRIYFLIASLDPLMVLLFDEGSARLTSLPFKLGEFDNPLIHLANTVQQTQHPEFIEGTLIRWSFAQVDDHLGRKLKRTGPGFTRTRLMPLVARYIEHVIRAGRDRLAEHYPRQGDCFAVLGADVILDDRLHPWLTEIQTGPGLSFIGNPAKEPIIPPMLGEAARIMLEIRARRIAHRPLTDLDSVQRYQRVIDEAA